MESMVTNKPGGEDRSRKVIRHLLGREENRASAAPHHWYPRRKQAAKEVRELSGGELELISSVYHGDGRRHDFIHVPCGHKVSATMVEIRAKGAKVCPYCHEAAILASFGRLEDLQRYVMEVSGGTAYFFANNPIGGAATETYNFFCFQHGPYRATFTHFLANCGKTNGCPRCKCPGHSGERRGNVIFL